MRSILLAFLLSLSITSLAQAGHRLEYVCSNAYYDLYNFETDVIGSWTFVPQDGYGQVIYLLHFSGGRILQIPKPSKGLLLYEGMIQIGITYADNTPCDTASTPPIQIPMNECLGIAPSALNLPESGVFMVDSIEYAYNGNLSFLVPTDIIWQWDLWHEGSYILSFAQDEDMPCRIIESETP